MNNNIRYHCLFDCHDKLYYMGNYNIRYSQETNSLLRDNRQKNKGRFDT